MRGSLFCLFLTLFVWGCGSREGKKVDLKDLVFKCTITNPVEDEVMRMNINWSGGDQGVSDCPTVLGGDVRAEGLSPLLDGR